MAATFDQITKEDVIRFVNNYGDASTEKITALYGQNVSDYGGVDAKFTSLTFPKNSFNQDFRVSVIDLLFPKGTKRPVHADKNRYKIHLGIDDEGNRVEILSYADLGNDENAVFYKIQDHEIDHDFLIDKDYMWICEPHCIHVTDI